MTAEIVPPGPPVATLKPQVQLSARARRKSLVATIVGNLLEYYEWTVYAVFAPFLAAALFNNENPVSALLATLAVFAVGFLVRPLGGFVFGRLADRKGRKFVLLLTMMMMALGSTAIGLLPTYADVGVWASALLLLCRMIQGLAHGGEAAAANTYVAEIAPSHRRGLWGSFVFIAVFGGSVIAYSVGGALTSLMTDSAVAEWGWRIPFLLGAVFAVVVIVIRRDMEESDVFDDGPATASTPEAGAQRGAVKRVVVVIAMVSGLTVTHYTWTSYMSTYAIANEGMSASGAFWALMLAQAISVVTIPLWGILSDRIGRRPIWLGYGILMAVLSIPMREMVTDQAWTLFVPALVVLVLVAGPGSILAATMSEAFPTRMRTQGIGLAYSIAIAVFGGSAPYLNALVIDLGHGWVGGAYLTVLCVCTIVATLFSKETKGIDLRHA